MDRDQEITKVFASIFSSSFTLGRIQHPSKSVDSPRIDFNGHWIKPAVHLAVLWEWSVSVCPLQRQFPHFHLSEGGKGRAFRAY